MKNSIGLEKADCLIILEEMGAMGMNRMAIELKICGSPIDTTKNMINAYHELNPGKDVLVLSANKFGHNNKILLRDVDAQCMMLQAALRGEDDFTIRDGNINPIDADLIIINDPKEFSLPMTNYLFGAVKKTATVMLIASANQMISNLQKKAKIFPMLTIHHETKISDTVVAAIKEFVLAGLPGVEEAKEFKNKSVFLTLIDTTSDHHKKDVGDKFTCLAVPQQGRPLHIGREDGQCEIITAPITQIFLGRVFKTITIVTQKGEFVFEI